MENLPSLGDLIRCQSDHDDYVYSRGRVAMSGHDGMGSNTRVPVARRVWMHVVTYCLI
jgi:hypothetical protein